MALATAIVTSLFYQGNAFLPLAKLSIERQKAKNLALGGVQLALSKLNSLPEDIVESDSKEPQKKQKPKEQKLLEQILPSINQWDTVNLTQAVDGVDGKIEFCLSCEQGKINLNQLYDFDKHEFKDLKITVSAVQKDQNPKASAKIDNSLEITDSKVSAYEQALELLFLQVSKITNQEQEPGQILASLLSFLRARQYQLLDVTELLEIPEFSYFKTHVFRERFEPSDPDQVQYDQKNIYLTDLFTVHTNSARLEPWLLSDAILTILDFPRAGTGDIMKAMAAERPQIKNFKVNSRWQTDWDQTVGLMYGVKFNALPKLAVDLFDTRFNPRVFSVLSYGTASNITQGVLAIIKLQTQGKTASFVVEKLYSI